MTVACKRRSSVNSGAWLRTFDDVTAVEKLHCKRNKWKKSKGKISYYCKWICTSPKHLIYWCLRCLKIVYIHNCWNIFFVPKPLWNSDKQKLSNFRMDFFYRCVISPFAIKLFLLPFSFHCSPQNSGFSDCCTSTKLRCSRSSAFYRVSIMTGE